jgi:hypothetical protein
MAFIKFTAPNLPAPPQSYQFPYFNQLIRQLNNYFNIHDSKAGLNVDNITAKTLQLPIADLVLTAGNNDNIQPAINTFLRITAPGNFNVRGINSSPQNQNDGRVIILLNASGSSMTIYNNEATVTAANRISTGGAAATMAASRAVLIYSIKDSRWQLIAHEN